MTNLFKMIAVALLVTVGFSACHSSRKATGTKSLYHALKSGLPEAHVGRMGDTIKVIYPELAMFDFGKDQVKADAKPSFVRFADVLKRYPNVSVTINGYTDNVGAAAANLDLSNRRAVSGRDMLRDNGVDAARMSTAGFGEQYPVMPNVTEEGKSANRRVEFLLYRK